MLSVGAACPLLSVRTAERPAAAVSSVGTDLCLFPVSLTIPCMMPPRRRLQQLTLELQPA